MRAFKGYRTVFIAALVAIVGALQGLDWVALIPNNPQAVGYITMGIGVVFAGLRAITDSPLGKSQ
jgi:hypothetical protein